MCQIERRSICCTAFPLGELYEVKGEYFGRCQQCKEGTTFYTEQEFKEMDNVDMQNRKISHRPGN
jgi:hypothetical protein